MLAAVRDLSFIELVAETLRAALDDVAAAAPDWLRGIARPVWFERYGRRVEEYRLPKGREEREAFALLVGADGFALLDALDAPDAPPEAREPPMVGTLRHVWRVHYAREDDGRLRWRAVAELPPVADRVQSPYDPEAHFSLKREFGWTGYKVHVTETCDDDTANLATDVQTCPAMQPDMTSTAGIHERLAAKGLLPGEHFVDTRKSTGFRRATWMRGCWPAVGATTASRLKDPSGASRAASGTATSCGTSPSTGTVSG